jgi:hypothetical protein
MDEDRYQPGGGPGLKWGCAATLIAGLPSGCAALTIIALGHCAPDRSCLSVSAVFAIAFGFTAIVGLCVGIIARDATKREP